MATIDTEPPYKPAVKPNAFTSAEVSAEQPMSWDRVMALFDILYEHDSALLLRTYSDFEEISKENTIDVKEDNTGEGDIKPFEYAEHRYLGNSMTLPEWDQSEKGRGAQWNPLTLDNGLKLTYGEINGLAGDFFGSTTSISSGGNIDAQKALFQKAFGYLATSKDGKRKAEALLNALKGEVDKVNEAMKDFGNDMEEVNRQVQAVYKRLPFDLKLFDGLTKTNDAGAVYTELIKANLDHFGEWGRQAYNAGHACALEEAAKGGIDNLKRAYAMNAFCDHFLEDNFAAGHLRVPRKATMSDSNSPVALMRNLAANVMHEEDGNFGLQVISPAGTKWTCFGDAKLFQIDEDKTKAVNMEQCRAALVQSVQEVYDAYKSKTTIPESQFRAWQIAPDLAQVNKLNPKHRPLLFTDKSGKLYTRDGARNSTASSCMDGHNPVIEFGMWAQFYWQNKQWVGEKLTKALDLDGIWRKLGLA